jgi:hypothetical protein
MKESVSRMPYAPKWEQQELKEEEEEEEEESANLKCDERCCHLWCNLDAGSGAQPQHPARLQNEKICNRSEGNSQTRSHT